MIAARGSSFSAGADIRAVARGEGAALFTARGGFAGIVERERTKPLVACVQGPAVGGGFEIALACDLIVASSTAVLGFPEVSRSMLPLGGGLVRLARELGEHRAMRLLLTGELLPAARLAEWGLGADVTGPGEALAGALALARKIAGNAPLAVRACIEAIHCGRDQSETERWSTSKALAMRVLGSADAREGLAAFVERRDPVWHGR